MSTEPVTSAPPARPLPPEFFDDPNPRRHADNAALRSACPVHPINHPPGAEAYIVMDHATVGEAFADPRLSKRVSAAPAWWQDLLKDSSPVLIDNMLLADAPEHTRLRKLISRAFTPRKMALLRPRIQDYTDELIDAFPDAPGVTDLCEFALSLPLKVICEFLGVPYEDRDKLHEWGLLLSGAPYPDEETNRRLKWASDSIEAYLTALLDDRRSHLDEDLVSSLLRAADEEARFTDMELISTLILLINAGHKTTANLVGNGMEALFSFPDQLALLRSDPSLAPSAVEEFLRWEPPVYRGTLRIATEDMTVAGVDIGAESFVHVMITSANRDPAVFADPDRLDITRGQNKHFSFGVGAHFCPGAPLSRLEGEIAFSTLLRRLPDLRLAVRAEEVGWRFDNTVGRGLAALPVAYDMKLPR